MISSFYQRYSRFCIGAFLLSLMVIHPLAESIPPNNNTETWLSDDDGSQALYQEFRHHFGAEEVILVTLDRNQHDAEFLEVLSRRLEGLEEIRVVWSPDRFTTLMRRFGVSDDQIAERLDQVAVSKDGKLAGLVALLTPAGVADRATTMSQVAGVLEYCQLTPQDVHIAGAPVVIAE
ncbi:MAG: RND transporter, partial [Planctomycetaceae bacterium]